MKLFVISLQKEGKLHKSWDKIPFDLNPSRNIVEQAEQKVAAFLAEHETPSQNIAWKVYRYDGKRYASVSRSVNWVGD